MREHTKVRVSPFRAPVAIAIAVFGLLPLGFMYASHRSAQAEANIDYSRKVSTGVIQSAEGAKTTAAFSSALLGFLGPVGRVAGALLTGIISPASQESLVTDARYCDTAVNRSFTSVDLLTFTMPIQCQSMLRALGMPTDIEQISGGFGDTLMRVAKIIPPGEIGGPRCAAWNATSVSVTAPSTTVNGEPWDNDGSPPDLSLSLSIGSTKRTFPEAKDGLAFTWPISPPLELTTAMRMEVVLSDEDVLSSDQVIGVTTEVPGNLPNPKLWAFSEHGAQIEFSVSCKN